MKKYILVSIGILLIFFTGSCYYDKADQLYPPGSTTCDTTGTISYAQKVVPILQQQCYGCHAGGTPSGNISMGTYVADKAIAINGKLYGSISHSPGFSPMPQGGAKMNDCQIAIIKKWINTGTPSN